LNVVANLADLTRIPKNLTLRNGDMFPHKGVEKIKILFARAIDPKLLSINSLSFMGSFIEKSLYQ